MRRVSKKRAAIQRDRQATVQAVLARDRGCRAALLVPDVKCWGPLDVHEILTRARGGSIIDEENCIVVCRRHHDWIGQWPARAAELGLTKHSWERQLR